MAHPLEQKIGRIRRQARWLLATYAIGWIVACVGAAVLVLGTADFLIRFQDQGIRVLCSLAIVLLFAWAVVRFGLRSWGVGLGDVQLARLIERYYPALTDRLASTVQFLKQSELDVQAGSAALRRAVIVETTSVAESLDFSQAIERRPARRALLAAGAVGLVAAAIALVAPHNARIAVARLARPWGNDAWPRVNNLAFENAPTRLASGQTFEVELVQDETHRVPDHVEIHYRYEVGGDVTEEIESMQLLNGAIVARKEGVTRPFSYRAEGGDDSSMGWIRLEVVEPPRLASLEVKLHPPDYTGLPVETSEKSIHALRGTKIELAGAATKELASAMVRLENGEELSAVVSPDGFGFTLAATASPAFVVDKTGGYWIILRDAEGLEGGALDRFDIRAVDDLAPTLTIEQPAANIFVTPQGTVPLKIVAKDDLAIREIGLHFSRSDNADVADFALPLYQGPDRVAPLEAGGLLAAGRLGESRTTEKRWPLADLKLQAGSQVSIWATAGDYRPQTGKSTVRRLTIISPQELEERLAQRQMLIFGELQRVLKLEQDARGQTKSLEIQLEKVGHLAKEHVDHAQSAELNQRQITRTLTSPTEGIPAQIDDFLADLANNQVDSPDMQRRMAAISEELARLGQGHLSTIERELTSAIKAAQAALPRDGQAEPAAQAADPQIAEPLKTAGQSQDAVIQSLDGMIEELRQWDSYRRFAREVAQLQAAQEAISRGTKKIAEQTLGRDAKDLSAQQQADLQKLAAEQTELSRRLEKTQQQMAEMGASLEQTDPLAAAAINDGLHHARQQAISGQMRQTSDRLAQNQLSQAAAQQAKIAKDLDEMMGILSNRREQELARLVEQLRAAEREMAQLRAQQQGLRKQMSELAKQPDSAEKKQQLQRLARQQKQVQDEAARLARRLERLQAEAAGRSTADASGKMEQSGQAGEQGDAGEAEQQAAGAEKDLEDAQQQLAERRQQAEADLAREQLAKLQDALKGLHGRQEKLNGETERLEKLHAAAGKFTRAQAATVHDVARQQKLLQTETALLAEKLALAEVIHMALDGAAKQMARASLLLERERTGGPTQTAQEAARTRLAQLLAALDDKSKKPPQEGEQGEGGAGGANSGTREDGSQVLAQLKLLKLLQEDLNTRFKNATANDQPADGKGSELAEIASEQGKLAELTLKLSQPADAKPEDDPESLPDVRQEGLEPAPELEPNLQELLEDVEKEPSR
jgi:hypothetical protein